MAKNHVKKEWEIIANKSNIETKISLMQKSVNIGAAAAEFLSFGAKQ